VVVWWCGCFLTDIHTTLGDLFLVDLGCGNLNSPLSVSWVVGTNSSNLQQILTLFLTPVCLIVCRHEIVILEVGIKILMMLSGHGTSHGKHYVL
jgi:hypothetical protein